MNQNRIALTDEERKMCSDPKNRPRLERLAQKVSKRLGRTVSVEEMLELEKGRRRSKGVLHKVERLTPGTNVTRIG